MAQRKRVGLITQRSLDRDQQVLSFAARDLSAWLGSLRLVSTALPLLCIRVCTRRRFVAAGCRDVGMSGCQDVKMSGCQGVRGCVPIPTSGHSFALFSFSVPPTIASGDRESIRLDLNFCEGVVVVRIVRPKCFAVRVVWLFG